MKTNSNLSFEEYEDTNEFGFPRHILEIRDGGELMFREIDQQIKSIDLAQEIKSIGFGLLAAEWLFDLHIVETQTESAQGIPERHITYWYKARMGAKRGGFVRRLADQTFRGPGEGVLTKEVIYDEDGVKSKVCIYRRHNPLFFICTMYRKDQTKESQTVTKYKADGSREEHTTHFDENGKKIGSPETRQYDPEGNLIQ